MNKKLNYFSAIKFLSKYINKHKKNFILIYLGWFFNNILLIYVPITFAVMVDEIIYYQNIDIFLRVGLVFAVMLLFSCILHFFTETQHCYLSVMYVYDIKRDIFDHILNAEAEYLSDIKTGDIINTCGWYAGECMHFVVRNVIHMMNHVMMLVLLVAYVFLLGWQIGLLLLVVVPLSVFVSVGLGKKTRKFAEQQRKNEADYNSWLFEMLSGIRDIRMMGAKNTADRSFLNHQKKIIKVNETTGFLTKTADHAITVIQLLIMLSIYGVVAYMASKHQMTVGMLTVVLTYFTNMIKKVRIMSGMYLEAQNRISFIQHIYDLLHAPTEKEWTGKKELKVTDGKITFHNIDFSYRNQRTIFSDLSLSIRPEDKLALVGKSGEGKSTLAYMLIGFYKPKKGYIEIDGQRLCDCSLKSIRENIGIVQQEALLFDGTIAENLLLGHRGAAEEEMLAACERAGILSYIEGLPEGIHTVIGKNGVGLSGGQKQRLAIARIYLKDPKILIFDEATSALDSQTEEDIHRAWEGVLKGRTAIMIAHRQSSVLLCKRIAILEGGRIVETGTPEEMIQKSSTFRTLFAVKEAAYD